MKKVIRLATRESALAMWQANYVKDALEAAHPGLNVEIMGMTTQGDRDKQTSLTRLGGKGVFVKELEVALLEDRVDIAVHSMKDVPAEMPEGLGIVAICEREDPRDAFISNGDVRFEQLTAGARIGSSSLRRRLQLQAKRADLEYADVRGNVETRLGKLDAGEYDAIILAMAGVKRLNLANRVTHPIDPEISIPAAGQGAVGIEARVSDEETCSLIAAINHQDTFDRVTCEREVSIGLGASCELPIAAYASLEGDQIRLNTYVGTGGLQLRESGSSHRAEAMDLARGITERLIAAGALRQASK